MTHRRTENVLTYCFWGLQNGKETATEEKAEQGSQVLQNFLHFAVFARDVP